MKVITIATQKGGAGKTTIATNLAVASSFNKKKTLLIDADARQKTALEWFNRRENQDNPIVVETEEKQSLLKLINLSREKGIERIFIDTQGAESNLVNYAIEASDFCLIPCRSSGFDISAQRSTASTVRQLKKDAAFIITQSPSRGQEVIETKTVLSGLGILILEHKTTLLKAYKDAALFGSSVLEDSPNSKAAQEIESILQWLEKRLNKNSLLTELKEV